MVTCVKQSHITHIWAATLKSSYQCHAHCLYRIHLHCKFAFWNLLASICVQYFQMITWYLINYMYNDIRRIVANAPSVLHPFQYINLIGSRTKIFWILEWSSQYESADNSDCSDWSHSWWVMYLSPSCTKQHTTTQHSLQKGSLLRGLSRKSSQERSLGDWELETEAATLYTMTMIFLGKSLTKEFDLWLITKAYCVFCGVFLLPIKNRRQMLLNSYEQ